METTQIIGLIAIGMFAGMIMAIIIGGIAVYFESKTQRTNHENSQRTIGTSADPVFIVGPWEYTIGPSGSTGAWRRNGDHVGVRVDNNQTGNEILAPGVDMGREESRHGTDTTKIESDVAKGSNGQTMMNPYSLLGFDQFDMTTRNRDKSVTRHAVRIVMSDQGIPVPEIGKWESDIIGRPVDDQTILYSIRYAKRDYMVERAIRDVRRKLGLKSD
jgi:hypothetical protein